MLSRALIGFFVAALLVGCATPQPDMDSAQSSTDNIQKAKAAGIRPLNVGEFTFEAGVSAEQALHLKDNLTVDLQGAGLLDPSASTLIQGRLIDAELGKRSGMLAARFTVIQAGGSKVFERELRTSSAWRKGANVGKEHAALFRKLVGVLLSDPGLRNAVSR
jgi:hypothetical protein